MLNGSEHIAPVDLNSPICGIRKFTERDIDLLMAEELRVNATFAAWVMSHFALTESLIYPALTVNVSDVEDGSEADVAVTFKTIDGHCHRLFIEDKIDATLMPFQLERYVRRGQGEVARNFARSFSVLFFTPSAYRHASLPDGVVRLDFEDAVKHLRRNPTDLRSCYRASVLQQALPKSGFRARDAYIVKNEPYIKAWWDAVYVMLERDFSGFFHHRTRYPRSVYFAPETHGQARYLRVDFKGHKGEVDLAFKDVDINDLRRLTATLDNMPGRLAVNGQSSALRIAGLEPFVISDGMAVIDSKVRSAYAAAHRLLTFWKTHCLAFDAMVADAKRSMA